MTERFRKSTVAGTFFPAEADALSAQVTDLIAEAQRVFDPMPEAPQAVISPHAGYNFSGLLTAAALSMRAQSAPERVVILSPAHKLEFDGMAVPSAKAFELPGMYVPVHKALRRDAMKARLVQMQDDAFDGEHGIETQLPFIHTLYPEARVLPVVIGQCEASDVAALIDFVLEDDAENTLIVLSSDLSHFMPAEDAAHADHATAALIEAGADTELTGQQACGARAINGWFASTSGAGSQPMCLGMLSSAKHTGDRSRVVGYGAWAIQSAGTRLLDNTRHEALLSAARKGLELYFRSGKMPRVDLASFSPRLHTVMGSFVTLKKEGQLRGCIGSMLPHQALVQDVVENAIKAAVCDRRFDPMTAEDLDAVDIQVSILTPACDLVFASEEDAQEKLRPGITGAILTCGDKRGVFLPTVWDSLPTPGAFLKGLKRKAGLPADFWSDEIRIETFEAEVIGEESEGFKRAA